MQYPPLVVNGSPDYTLDTLVSLVCSELPLCVYTRWCAVRPPEPHIQWVGRRVPFEIRTQATSEYEDIEAWFLHHVDWNLGLVAMASTDLATKKRKATGEESPTSVLP